VEGVVVLVAVPAAVLPAAVDPVVAVAVTKTAGSS